MGNDIHIYIIYIYMCVFFCSHIHGYTYVLNYIYISLSLSFSLSVRMRARVCVSARFKVSLFNTIYKRGPNTQLKVTTFSACLENTEEWQIRGQSPSSCTL